MLFHVFLLLGRSHANHLLLIWPHRHLLAFSFLLLCRIRVINYSDANVSLLERANIICTITTHKCEVAQLIKHADDHSLLGGGCTRENVDIANDHGSIRK